MRRAMEVAIGRAREFHVGWCVARDITHAGAIRHYVEIAAEASLIGLAMTASGPMMAYQGRKGEVVSTNPTAHAVQAAARTTLILELAHSVASLRPIHSDHPAGPQLPEEWG